MGCHVLFGSIRSRDPGIHTPPFSGPSPETRHIQSPAEHPATNNHNQLPIAQSQRQGVENLIPSKYEVQIKLYLSIQETGGSSYQNMIHILYPHACQLCSDCICVGHVCQCTDLGLLHGFISLGIVSRLATPKSYGSKPSLSPPETWKKASKKHYHHSESYQTFNPLFWDGICWPPKKWGETWSSVGSSSSPWKSLENRMSNVQIYVEFS